MNETITVELRELLVIKNGKDYKHLKAGEIPVYGTGGIMTYVNSYIYEGESILLPRKGTLDNICYVNGRFWTVDTMYWSIIHSSKVYPKYLYCYLSLLDLSCRDSGSTLPSMTFDAYYSLPIKLPNYEIQKKIGDWYFTINSKISNNSAINAELEAMAKTIYDYWFLQFEFPDENGKPYKSSGGEMVWNEELKRDIPEGWEVGKVNDFIDMVNGYPFSSDDYLSNGSFKIYTIKNVQDGNIISEVTSYLNSLPPKMSRECVLAPCDIIMSLTGNVGRVGLVYERNALLNQRVVKIVPHNNHIAYTYLMFRDASMKTRMDNLAIGAAQANLSPVNVGNLLIPIPDESLLIYFDQLCNTTIEKIVTNNQENQELASLRDFLLPLLMNGQVGFKE